MLIKRRFALLTIVAMLLAVAFSLSACNNASVKNTTQASLKAKFPVKVTDDTGKTVRLSKKPSRIVSMSPGNTEILFAIGLDKEIVGVTSFDDYPEKAKSKAKIGGFSTPNVEKIISLKPDLVVATGGIQTPIRKRLSEAKLEIYTSDAKTVNGVLTDILKLGNLTGKKVQAKKLVNKLRERIKAVKKRLPKSRKKVFFEIYGQPLTTAAKGTFVNDLIRLAGGINVAGKQNQAYPQYSLEQLINDNPDVYFVGSGSMSKPEEINKRFGWNILKAVKNKKVYVVDENLFLRPGPRLIDGLEIMAKKMYPKAFSNGKNKQ